jgi:predicted enzyme related to lactoylglutathione lyase
MILRSVRIITADLDRLVGFYEMATGCPAKRYGPEFVEIDSPGALLAIGSTRTLQMFGGESVANAGSNRSVIIEFRVDDVDREYERLTAATADLEVVQPPTTMPWGNRSLLFRDPDGNLVNFFHPVAAAAS